MSPRPPVTVLTRYRLRRAAAYQHWRREQGRFWSPEERASFYAGYTRGYDAGYRCGVAAPTLAAPAPAAWWRLLAQWAFTYQVRGQGAQELHRSWRDHLLTQSRPVDKQRLAWETLDDQDQVLCDAVVLDLIQHFITWACADIERQEAAATDV